MADHTVVNLQNAIYAFSANACGGSTPYTYRWQRSFGNPYSFGSTVSTNQTYQTTLGPGDWYLKVTVTSSNGISSSATTSVYVEDRSTCDPTDISCGGSGFSPSDNTKLPSLDSGLEELPNRVILHPAYPNPFNPQSVLSFTLPAAGEVSLHVYDIGGKLVRTLVSGILNAGNHEYKLDGSEMTSGTYIVELITTQSRQTQKITLLK